MRSQHGIVLASAHYMDFYLWNPESGSERVDHPECRLVVPEIVARVHESAVLDVEEMNAESNTGPA